MTISDTISCFEMDGVKIVGKTLECTNCKDETFFINLYESDSINITECVTKKKISY